MAQSKKSGVDGCGKNNYSCNLGITLHGMVTVGPKGQIVIPLSARRELNLEQGDQLMAIVKFGKVVGFFKANLIEELEAAVVEEIKNIKQKF